MVLPRRHTDIEEHMVIEAVDKDTGLSVWWFAAPCMIGVGFVFGSALTMLIMWGAGNFSHILAGRQFDCSFKIDVLIFQVFNLNGGVH